MTKEKLRKIMGKNIRIERKIRGMTREELSKLMGISVAYIGLIERGLRGITAHNLFWFSNVLDVPIEKIFNLQEQVKNPCNEEAGKRNDVTRLILSMDNIELDYIIQIINGIRKMKRKTITKG
jgi:transcriptional regulator with XRE-family HTH domain